MTSTSNYRVSLIAPQRSADLSDGVSVIAKAHKAKVTVLTTSDAITAFQAGNLIRMQNTSAATVQLGPSLVSPSAIGNEYEIMIDQNDVDVRISASDCGAGLYGVLSVATTDSTGLTNAHTVTFAAGGIGSFIHLRVAATDTILVRGASCGVLTIA